MNKDKKKMKKMTERILNHALQIIYLLTGEEYTIVKKNSPHSSIHLTGEVPIKCDDVAIYFSMEEWEYIDGHKEFYKDIMMCKHQTLQNLGTPANWDSDDEILDTASISDSRNEEKDVKHNQQVEIISAESNADIVLNTEQTEDLCVGDQLESLEHEIGDNNSTGMCNENICSLSVIKDDKDVKNIHQVETLPDVYPGFHNVNLDPPSVIKGVNDEASFQHVETLPNIYADRFANWNMLEESSTTVCSSECTVKDHNGMSQKVLQEGSKKLSPKVSDLCDNRNPKLTYMCYQPEHKSCALNEMVGKYYSDSILTWKEKKKAISHYAKSISSASVCEEPQASHTGEKLVENRAQSKLPVVHHRTHKVDKHFACPDNKCFSKMPQLVANNMPHKIMGAYVCQQCGKNFYNKSNLIAHQRIHTGVKPYICQICGKPFSKKSNLVTHLRTHTGEKPFACHVCEKCFSHRVSLDVHQRTHTGERPYICKMCGRSFSDRSGLSKHCKTHTLV